MHTGAFVLRHEKTRTAPAAAVSLTAHVVVLGGLMLLRFAPHSATLVDTLPETVNQGIVWLSERGPGGGGGGGGNQMKEPPRAATLRGSDAITVPAQKRSQIDASASTADAPPQPDIPLRELASGADFLPGIMATPPGPPALSQGAGTHGGAGTGDGVGIGPGRGPGLGDGSGGNTGGSVRRPGNGVTDPILIREVKPAYTAEAMRARLQGSVWVQCIVGIDGSVSEARVVRALDAVFGLDQEALRAARQWKFRPATLRGEPVPVLVTIELVFTLR
ncbi:MAG TPA: energy transducer TonB [Vicinamibacterales bacterium]|jgi:TonB family protein